MMLMENLVPSTPDEIGGKEQDIRQVLKVVGLLLISLGVGFGLGWGVATAMPVPSSIAPEYVENADMGNPETGEMVACPMDALLCPDGSSVGRSGPNCEFAACPAMVDESGEVENVENTTEGGELGVCTMDAMECPDGSFVGRVPPSCEFAACP